MSLKQFKSISEKEGIFNHYIINDISSLKEKLKLFSPRKARTPVSGIEVEIRYFFRGVNDARFRIYSSIQRCLVDRQKTVPRMTLSGLSDEILARFETNKTLVDAFKNEVNADSYNSQPAAWAFLQHFGAPSHLIDFTPNIRKAIYFATLNANKNYTADDNDLANYISLYIYQDNPTKNCNLNTLYSSSSMNARSLIENHLAVNPQDNIDTIYEDRRFKKQPFEPEFWGASIYGSDIFEIIIPGSGHRLNVSYKNTNIELQEGNFFLGNIMDVVPLELCPNLRYKIPGANNFQPYGYCLDIHRKLIDDIIAEFEITRLGDLTPYRDFESEMKELWKPSIINK